MRPLRHSYTNRTLGDGVTVVKCYQGPGALARSRLEQAMLHALQGRVPVPQILDCSDGCLTMTFMNGIHGQELLDAGRAGGVLRACGTMLWRIHQLGTGGIAALATAAGDGQVLVHGDYGPDCPQARHPARQDTGLKITILRAQPLSHFETGPSSPDGAISNHVRECAVLANEIDHSRDQGPREKRTRGEHP